MPMKMRRRWGFVCVLLAAVLASFSSWAGAGVWTSGGPYGGDIYCLAVDPSTPATLYAGTASGGVFKTTDGGTNWEPKNHGLEALYSYGSFNILVLVIDPKVPSTLYAGTYAGVFKSTDGGATWSVKSNGFSMEISDVPNLVIDPVTPSTLYASARGDGYKSIDGGEH